MLFCTFLPHLFPFLLRFFILQPPFFIVFNFYFHTSYWHPSLESSPESPPESPLESPSNSPIYSFFVSFSFCIFILNMFSPVSIILLLFFLCFYYIFLASIPSPYLFTICILSLSYSFLILYFCFISRLLSFSNFFVSLSLIFSTFTYFISTDLTTSLLHSIAVSKFSKVPRGSLWPKQEDALPPIVIGEDGLFINLYPYITFKTFTNSLKKRILFSNLF